MPSQLFNIKRYFGKKDEPEPDTAPTPASGATQADETSTVVTTTQTTQESQQPQPYSGIGYPPKETVKKTTKTTIAHTDKTGQPASTPSPVTPAMSRRVGMDVLTRLTQRSNQALLKGVNKARQLQVQYIDTEHALWGLIQDSGIYQLLSELKVTPSEIQTFLEKNFKRGNFKLSPQFSPRVKRVLELSLSAARALGYEFISPEHLLLALAQEGEGVAAQALSRFGVTVTDLNKKITGKKEGVEEEEKRGRSTLEQYCDDLTQKAREGRLDPVVGRAAEIERIIHILSRRTKNNPCLIGDAGVGKTAIVEGLAQKIATGDVPETLLDKRILSLDLMSLVAGARHRGEFEERLKNLLKEIQAASGQIILFIDEIQNMVGAGAGSEGTLDVSNIMKPSLARGELQAIGTTTVTEYRRYIEKDPALERRFQPVQVSEPSADPAIEMLRAIRDKYEAHHKVSISDEAIQAAVRLSQKYIGDRFLPDKAVDLIDEAAAAVRLPAISLPEEIKSLQEKIKRLESEKKEAEKLKDNVKLATLDKELAGAQELLAEKIKAYEKRKSTTTNVVGPEIIADIVARWTGIPVSRLTESESEKLLKLEELIHERYINQQEAVAAVSEAVRRGRAGLTSGKRPIGSFIFMGPTGVGKTELCKVLADILFGSPDLMVRLDMSEYMEKHEVAKLIGAPPGYVGYEEGGQLTEAVRRHPYSVVLLDEIEKAHPDVFNILLQILDDGRLTDNKGHVISFKNTIICCTSNIGTQLIQKDVLGTGKISFAAPAFSTYAITPTGREIITLKDRFWAKTKSGQKWKTDLLTAYFAGCDVKKATGLPLAEKLPQTGFDSHTFAPNGEEIVVVQDRVWWRKSPIAKEWETASLVDYFKGQTVVNAAPDDPTQTLPTAKIDTWAIDADGGQIISFGDRVWLRQDSKDKAWTTRSLEEYLGESVVVKPNPERSVPSSAQEELEKASQVITDPELVLPTKKCDIHLFAPRGEEILILGDRVWKRKSKEEKEWTTENLTDYFIVQAVEGTDSKDEELQLPLGQAVEKFKKEQEELEDDKFAALAERLIEELKKFFRPEILNRFDEVIVFRLLSAESMLKIVELQFDDLGKRLEEQGIGFQATPSARQEIAVLGYDPVFGARPLRRAIQRYVENEISSLIIKDGVRPGESIVVDFDGNEFTFGVERVEKVAPVPRPIPAAQKYVCLDCGKEFEVPKEEREEEKPSGLGSFPDSPDIPDSPYTGETTAPVSSTEASENEEVKDTMTPTVANFTDDLDQPLEEQQTTDSLQQEVNDQFASTETNQPSQPSESSDSPDLSAESADSSDFPDVPDSSGPQIVCPYCGSSNVKLAEEAKSPPADSLVKIDSEVSKTDEKREVEGLKEEVEVKPPKEKKGGELEAFYGVEEPVASVGETIASEETGEVPTEESQGTATELSTDQIDK